MTGSELKTREIKSREEIADKDREQKEKSDKRAARASFYGSAVKGLTSMIGKMNDVSFYTKIKTASAVNASIPDFNTIGFEDLLIERFAGRTSVAVPAVFQINYAPTIGNTRSEIKGAVVSSTLFGQDSMNRALNRVCTQLEQRNSRVLSYTRDTVGRYLFAVTDIAVDINNLKVAIDAFDMASVSKPFVARQIIRAKGFDYNDFKQNISAYRSMYVSLVEDFNTSLPIPSDLTFLKRQLWLSNTVVKDMKSEYCSFIVFNKCIRFSFEPTASSKPDIYYAQPWYTGGNNYVDYVQGIKRNIQYLVNGATWKPLIRDLRGGTKSNLWLQLPNDAHKKTFVISDVDEVRSQLHNMNILPCILLQGLTDVSRASMNLNSFNIWGDATESVRQGGYESFSSHDDTAGIGAQNVTPGTIYFFCADAAAQSAVLAHLKSTLNYSDWSSRQPYGKHYIYSMLHDAKPEEALVATRFKLGWAAYPITLTINSGEAGFSFNYETGTHTVSTPGSSYFAAVTPVQYGTEIVCSIKITPNLEDTSIALNDMSLTAQSVFYSYGYFMNSASELVLSNEYLDTTYKYVYAHMTGSNLYSRIIEILGAMSTLDWMPLVTFAAYDAATSPLSRVYGELDHYTVFAADVMGKLHSQCIESEFTLDDSNFLPPLS